MSLPHTEVPPESVRTHRRNGDRATAGVSAHPSAVEEELVKRSTDRTSDVRPALAPIHARTAERALATFRSQANEPTAKVETQALEKLDALRRHRRPFGRPFEMAGVDEKICNLDGHFAGKMIVALARPSHALLGRP